MPGDMHSVDAIVLGAGKKGPQRAMRRRFRLAMEINARAGR